MHISSCCFEDCCSRNKREANKTSSTQSTINYFKIRKNIVECQRVVPEYPEQSAVLDADRRSQILAVACWSCSAARFSAPLPASSRTCRHWCPCPTANIQKSRSSSTSASQLSPFALAVTEIKCKCNHYVSYEWNALRFLLFVPYSYPTGRAHTGSLEMTYDLYDPLHNWPMSHMTKYTELSINIQGDA